MPSLRQLEYLVALAETRNFRRAAERVNTTQPTLSEQLKALEQRLGTQLVERSRAKVMLTQVGGQVAEIARRILRDTQEIRALAASGGKGLSGLIRLGLPPTIGPYLLPRVVSSLHERHRELKLYIREELPQALPRALEDGLHDVIVSPLPITGADIETVQLFREPLFLTVPADHLFGGRPEVDRNELAGQDVLALGPGHQLHNVVLALCEELGANLRFDYEGTSLDTLREMVVMGLGITFLPGLYVRSVISRDRSLRTVGIEGRSLYRTIGMAWRKSSARREAFGAFADFFREAMPGDFGAAAQGA